MRYMLASILLVGCSTTEPVAPVVVSNKDKDAYIEKVESVISDTASALTAVAPTVPAGVPRELVENQVTRLSGISKPTVEKTDAYRNILKTNDQSAVEQDKKEALKIDSEINKLWAIVEEQETAITIANAIAENADKERQGAMKDKVLWMLSCIGVGVSLVGLALMVFTPLKKQGMLLMSAGALSVFSAWILDSKWFPWVVGIAVGAIVLQGLVVLTMHTINHIRHRLQVRDTPQDNEGRDT